VRKIHKQRKAATLTAACIDHAAKLAVLFA